MNNHAYDSLEPRHLLAFLGFLDGTTLTITQTIDDGNIVIDNNGLGNGFRVTNGAGTADFVVATNVIIDPIANTGNELTLNLDNGHPGDVQINAGNGARTINFGGNLQINSGDGNRQPIVFLGQNECGRLVFGKNQHLQARVSL